MSSEFAVRATNVSKTFLTYEAPQHRLFQALLRLAAVLLPFGSATKQRLATRAAGYARSFPALSGIDLSIPRGHSVGIIGRNGSGKSTLLQIICGTLAATSGSVQANGRVAALLELGSGFNPEYSGRENVLLNAQLLGLKHHEVLARFDQIAAFADIGDFIEQPVKTYSSGMFVRLAFAVIAHVDADILIIDEALAVGDAFFTQKCMRFLRNFMAHGTLLFVSHDTAAVKSLCDEVVWIDHGRICEIGPPKDVCNHYLEAFYDHVHGVAASTGASISRIEDSESVTDAGVDARAAFINNSNLRNDLQIFAFNPASPGFGLGGAQILGAKLVNAAGDRMNWIVGGENVTLQVRIDCNTHIDSPIVGFQVKDRLGQVLIGENTYLAYVGQALDAPAGSRLTAKFTFQMPIFPKGDYSIDVAIASGSQNAHVQHHWLHDALFFRSESTSTSTGLVGVPMKTDLRVDNATLPK